VVQFPKKECNIFDNSDKWLMGGEMTVDNCYGLPGLTSEPQIICNKATIGDSELWHQRLGHLNVTNMLKIASKKIVKDLPKMEKTEKGVCGPCQLGKQTQAAHKKTSGILTSRNLELLHMDLMGPIRTASLGERKYILVFVDDYSRFTWAFLLREKSDVFDAAQQLFKKNQIEQNYPIMRIRSDHGREFENARFEEFCHSHGIQQEFSYPHYSLTECNDPFKESSSTLLGEAVNTAYHIINRVYLRPETNKTPYEIWQGKKPTVKYFWIFGSKCYILRDRENLEKFDPKSDEGIFLGYSTNSRAYRVFNKRIETVMESINVVIDDEEVGSPSKGEKTQSFPKELSTPLADMVKPSSSTQETSVIPLAADTLPDLPVIPSAADSLPDPPEIVTSRNTTSASEDEDESTNPLKRSWVKLNHPSRQLIGNLEEGRRLRNRVI
jgi:hypothetical protein